MLLSSIGFMINEALLNKYFDLKEVLEKNCIGNEGDQEGLSLQGFERLFITTYHDATGDLRVINPLAQALYAGIMFLIKRISIFSRRVKPH